MAYQSEQELENKIVAQLAKQGFERVQITDTKSLWANLKAQLSKLNGFDISETEVFVTDCKLTRMMALLVTFAFWMKTQRKITFRLLSKLP